MNVPIKLDKDFENRLDRFYVVFGKEFEILNGLHETQLNFSDFIDGFIDKKISDISVDTNANVSTKDIRSLMSEKGKSEDKLFCLNKIYYELKKKYGVYTANQWLREEYSGGFYLHDAHTSSYYSYCYAYDLTRLATEGLFFLNNYNNQAPKHLTTFLDSVIEYISYMSNRSSGAVGLPNLLIWTYYFWKKDCENNYFIKDPEYYIRQNFQKFIYRINQPFMRIDQSGFINCSIFDRRYIEALFGGVKYPDGSYVIDEVEEIIKHQKTFMKVISEIRSENMFTFPVLTYSLLYKDGKFQDEEFARWSSDHNIKWNDSNFFVSNNVNSLSNCCFDGSQQVLTKSSNGIGYMTFKELYESSYADTKRNFTIFHNGSWVNGKLIRLPTRKMYSVETINNKIINVTDNHLNKTLDGLKKTEDLTISDYLMFNTRSLNKVNEVDLKLSYEQGFLVGMYLGDGSKSATKYNSKAIHLSLNADKYVKSKDILNKVLLQLNENNFKFLLSKPYNNVYPLTINSKIVYDFIEEYVFGNYCYEKELNLDCLLQSKEFRQGILEGYYLTDGGNANRIYTTSEKLVYQIECLLTSLGKNSIIDISDRRDESICIRDTIGKRNYILYCIRWYEDDNKRIRKNVYVKQNNSIYYKIKSIRDFKSTDKYCYCFEMPENEPYFTLPNGIITHNCRLVSDTSKLDAFINSIGGTALSIGSVKVNTINLMRIAYETECHKENYLILLERRALLCCQVLDRIRHIIKRNIEKGLLPNCQNGGIELDKQYNTIGINGFFETIEAFGYIKTDDFGCISYTEEGIQFANRIFDVLNEVKDSFVKDYSINIESIPGEKCAVTLCQKDNLIFNKKDKFIYSNQWFPLSSKVTMQEKLRVSAILDNKCSGGSICHINIDSNFPNNEMAWEVLNKVASSGVIYFAFNSKINECKNHHGFVGTEICPNCGEQVYDTYSRIVGFLTPTRAYSKDRLREFNSRQWFKTISEEK